MKVKCITYKNKELRAGELRTITYPLSIQKEYDVYGIMLYDGHMQYLLIGEENLPSWYSSEFFEVVENILPFEFYFDCKKNSRIETEYGYDFMIDAIWGYEELVKDETHIADLFERKDKAIRTFLKRKAEIDEMLE